VYRSPFLSRSGHRVLVAVDRAGRNVGQALIFVGESEPDIIKMLAHVLDHEDPPVMT
jgi:hypothetical protein